VKVYFGSPPCRLATAVVAGIIPNAGPAGILLLGRMGSATNVKADEELAAILTSYLGIAIENSALYEKTWSAQRELETKVQQRTQELAEANTVLMRLNKAKSDFVSAVSHELRTPLAAIKGYASLLASGQFGKLAQSQQERIAKIEKHSDLLAQFINNLLDIARIESGRVTMEHQPIPIDEFLTAVHDVVAPQMDAKHIRYRVDRDGVTQLLGDTSHLQRVFVNLLSNAIKYTPDGGSIRVGLKREGAEVIASVADTGCGIGPEDRAKLFQEFYRGNDPVNQQVRGTGLGLALVKRIVEAHHGRIWVESQKGQGSTFSVSLPTE
jgi:signal transduction histidine kinase